MDVKQLFDMRLEGVFNTPVLAKIEHPRLKDLEKEGGGPGTYVDRYLLILDGDTCTLLFHTGEVMTNPLEILDMMEDYTVQDWVEGEIEIREVFREFFQERKESKPVPTDFSEIQPGDIVVAHSENGSRYRIRVSHRLHDDIVGTWTYRKSGENRHGVSVTTGGSFHKDRYVFYKVW